MTTIRTLDPPRIGPLGILAKTGKQLSHAFGLFLLQPVANLADRGRLITGQFIILAALLAFAAAVASMSALAAASLVVAASSAATHPGYHPVPIRSRYGRSTSDL